MAHFKRNSGSLCGLKERDHLRWGRSLKDILGGAEGHPNSFILLVNVCASAPGLFLDLPLEPPSLPFLVTLSNLK